MKTRKLIVVLVMLAGIVTGLWRLGLISPTWVAFQSSDGEWADSEVLMKGRDFEDVVVSFEMYRIKCAASLELNRFAVVKRFVLWC